MWGHYTTKDFVHYRRETIAVYPDHPRDRDGVYSGSALEKDGKLYLYYTGNVRHADNFPADMTNHVRDPQIIQRDGRLYMLLGGRTQADVGCALVYESGDGSHFRLVNRLSTAEPFGYMWECPDLAVLDGQPLLICCPQGIPHQPFCYQNAHQ